jgi:hypothetical protein
LSQTSRLAIASFGQNLLAQPTARGIQKAGLKGNWSISQKIFKESTAVVTGVINGDTAEYLGIDFVPKAANNRVLLMFCTSGIVLSPYVEGGFSHVRITKNGANHSWAGTYYGYIYPYPKYTFGWVAAKDFTYTVTAAEVGVNVHWGLQLYTSNSPGMTSYANYGGFSSIELLELAPN